MSFHLNQFAGRVSEILLASTLVRAGRAVTDSRNVLGAENVKDQLGIKGTVVDMAGRPLARVAVHVEYLGPRPRIARRAGSDRVRQETVTGSAGEFCIGPLPPGRYRIRPSVSARDSACRCGASPMAAFLPREILLREKGPHDPLVLQAVPHVIIEARYVDSEGRPRVGPAPILSGRTQSDYFLTCCTVDRGGRVQALVPHGLQDVCMQLSANGFSAVRHRRGKNLPLCDEREIQLGVVTADVNGIEIVCYDAPSVSIRVCIDGNEEVAHASLPADLAIAARYVSPALSRVKRFSIKRGVYSHVWFEEHADGTYGSKELLPNEPVLITADAAGYHSSTATVCLGEGEKAQITLALTKTPGDDPS